MREIPLDVFLSFPLPNYKNPPTRGPALTIVNAILIALVIIAVLLRLYTRLFIKRWFGSDDVFIVFALVRPLCFVASARRLRTMVLDCCAIAGDRVFERTH